MTTDDNIFTRILDNYRKGNLEIAEADCRKLLREYPSNAEGHYLLGLILYNTGRLTEAEAAYRDVLKYKPGHVKACQNLGALLHLSGRLDAAAICYQKALAVQPDNQSIEYNLAHAYFAQQKYARAETHFRNVLAVNPGLHEVHFNMGRVLSALGNSTEAIQCYQQAINLKADYTDALNNMGTLLMSRGRYDEAINSFRHAMANAPDNPRLRYNMGIALKGNGQYAQAANSFREALNLDPDFSKAYAELCHCNQMVCEWRSNDYSTGMLVKYTKTCLGKQGESPVYPFDALSLPFTPEIQMRIAATHAGQIRRAAGPSDCFKDNSQTNKAPRLRIGYVSQKFNNHAGAHLIASLFSLHDRKKFEIFAYSIGADDNSTYRQRIMQGCDHFIDVAEENFTTIANRIHDDKINILVDLGVYNTFSRSEIFALRPAPVQVSYLGFPGTSGSDFYDYILTDRTVTPPDQQQWYTEKFVYLPHCYQVNDHLLDLPEQVPDRTACGLPDKGFVFCSFNNSYKIEPVMFDVWMNILARVPDSVLWLLAHSRETTTNLRREAGSRGIDSTRLVFAEKLPKELHLSRHRHAGLFLDTRVYNAHTTASDSLRVGVPVLTIPGATFASRVAASLLNAVNLPEMIATCAEEYADIAVKYSTDSQYMATIKTILSTNVNSSPLFDTPLYARHLEAAYRQMWDMYASGSGAQQVLVKPN